MAPRIMKIFILPPAPPGWVQKFSLCCRLDSASVPFEAAWSRLAAFPGAFCGALLLGGLGRLFLEFLLSILAFAHLNSLQELGADALDQHGRVIGVPSVRISIVPREWN